MKTLRSGWHRSADPTSSGDLVAALVNLGNKPSQLEKALVDTRRETPGASFHEILPLALRRLSRV